MKEYKYHLIYWLRVSALSMLIALLVLKLKENRLERKIEQLKIIEEVPTPIPNLEPLNNMIK